MSYEAVRYAILSPARWGRLLLDSVRSSTKLSFCGVWSRSQPNADEIVAAYGGQRYDSYEALLADDTVEAVLLPTPHFLHHPQAMAALRAGKHVFVEKPIANTVEQAQEMKALSEERHLTLSVGMQGRRTGAARMVKTILDRGDLGQVVLIVGVHGAPIARNYSADDWEMDPEKIPGGPLDQLGIHYADLMQYLLGPIVQVSGQYTDAITPSAVPDAATANYRFANGALGAYVTHQVSAYVSRLSLYGTQGALHIDRFGQELTWQDVVETSTAKTSTLSPGPIPFEGAHPFTTALTEELEEFADCIRLNKRPEVGAAEGIAALRVIRAVMQSQQTGQHVDLSMDGL